VYEDVQRVVAAGIDVANITAEPVAMSDIAAQVFGRALPTPDMDVAPSYDVRSLYASLAGGKDGYWFDANTVIQGIRRFVANERAR
jgi:hypothetical protein